MEASSPLSVRSSTPSPPTSPLSDLSTTPPLPRPYDGMPDRLRQEYNASSRYPSPISSVTSGTQSPLKTMTANIRRKMRESEDDSPPAKKRRLSPPKEPKERTTEYLDLMKSDDDWTEEDDLQQGRLMYALRKKKKVVVIAGAGISVSAGIPDFRSSTGLFASAGNQTNKMRASGKHLFDASVYKHDEATQSFHTMVRDLAQLSQEAKPTKFHHMLASLAREGRLLRLYSQNIDCIDTSMEPLATKVPLDNKGPWPTTIQLHGGLEKMVCTKCADLKDFDSKLFDGPEAPLCGPCTEMDQVRTGHAGKRSLGIGRLRPRFVLYNEANPDQDAIGNVIRADIRAKPDAVLVVGTTLKVPGARNLVKDMCQVARSRKGGFTAWINPDSEPRMAELKDCWDLVVRAKCDQVALEVALPPWDCALGDDHELKDGPSRQTTLAIDIRSVSSSPAPAIMEAQLYHPGIPTPRSSPKITAVKKVAKTKQTKLSFINTKKNASDGKAADKKPVAKVNAARGRPAKKAAKDTRPQKSILSNLKVKKVNEISDVKKSKPINTLPPPLVLEADPGLPALRPTRPVSRESYSSDSGLDIADSSLPCSPSAQLRPSSPDIITPTTVPKGFHNILA